MARLPSNFPVPDRTSNPASQVNLIPDGRQPFLYKIREELPVTREMAASFREDPILDQMIFNSIC